MEILDEQEKFIHNYRQVKVKCDEDYCLNCGEEYNGCICMEEY